MLNTFGKISFSIVCAGFLFASCYKKEDVKNTATVDMSGEWWVEYYVDGDPTTPISDFTPLLTYNTSDNSNSQIWIDDHTWPFKSKVGVSYSSLTFPETASAENLEAAGTSVKIYEGKVLKGQGHSKSGNVVDSIYLKVEFLDEDPGTLYQVRGHMKTGFFEDEY